MKSQEILSTHSMAESIIKYGLKVWGGTSSVRLDKVKKIQKKIMKIVIGDNTVNNNIYSTCGTLSPEGFYKYLHLTKNYNRTEYQQKSSHQ